jgi:hypothetical protein
VLVRRRLLEGVAGVSALHGLVADQPGDLDEPDQVLVGIETDRGPWVQALIAAGDLVYAINPLQVARDRERHGTAGAKSDPGDAHVLAEMCWPRSSAWTGPITGRSPATRASQST